MVVVMEEEEEEEEEEEGRRYQREIPRTSRCRMPFLSFLLLASEKREEI